MFIIILACRPLYRSRASCWWTVREVLDINLLDRKGMLGEKKNRKGVGDEGQGEVERSIKGDKGQGVVENARERCIGGEGQVGLERAR